MKIVMISEKGKLCIQGCTLRKFLQDYPQIEFCDYEYKKEEYMPVWKMKELQADIFIIFDLIGMEQVTLTEAVGINLVDAKILHFLTREKLKNEKMLARPLSIAMFFFCKGKSYETYLNTLFPDMPYLKAYDQDDKDAMVKAFWEVVHESYPL